jgi:hypothetical protein
MFSHESFEFNDSNEAFSEISGMGAAPEALLPLKKAFWPVEY